MELLTSALVLSVLTALYLQGRLVKKMRQSREAERRAQAAERLAELGSMTSGLAHEIKNPLSTVVLNAQLINEELEEAGLPPERGRRLRRRTKALEQEAVRLREILDDFLRFAGRMNLDPGVHDVRAVVDELVDFFHPQCVQAGVLIRMDLPERPVRIRFDEGLIKQALLNLMINALQSMEQLPEGAPRELLVKLETDEREVRIHIIDRGCGIKADRRDEIFHPYVSSKPGGSGLGLPTTRRIIEIHGGRIEVHSEIGTGSDFTVHLPWAVEDDSVPDQADD